MMVALMLDTALVLRLASSAARLERFSGPGDPPDGRRPCVGGRWDTPVVQKNKTKREEFSRLISKTSTKTSCCYPVIDLYMHGPCHISEIGGEGGNRGGEKGKTGRGNASVQSWTRSETFGLATRLLVFLDAGFVVMTMTGADEYGDDGRYV